MLFPSVMVKPLVETYALLAIALGITTIRNTVRSNKLARSGIHDIDRMQGRVFEEYLAVVFQRKGYHVELTPASKDQGADLVISKNGVRTVVQAKRWKGRVGNSAVQEVVASKPYYRGDHVELWDRKK